MTNKEKEAVQKFVDAAWPFIERAMKCDKDTVLCGWWPNHTPLIEAGGNLTVGDLRNLRDSYLQNIVNNMFCCEK